MQTTTEERRVLTAHRRSLTEQLDRLDKLTLDALRAGDRAGLRELRADRAAAAEQLRKLEAYEAGSC